MIARARKLAILLPPSEGKAPHGTGPPWRPGTMAVAGLDPRRRELLAALAAAGADHRHDPTLVAAARYTGVLYRELDPEALAAPLRKRFAAQALIFSGLWGVVGPADPVPDYKLKMSASVPGLGKLSTWWRPAITEAMVDRLAGHTVWDLLPIEHSAAWTPGAVPLARRHTVRFVSAEGTTISHWNKLLKGALVRFILEQQPVHADDLADFVHPAGYRYDPWSSQRPDDPTTIVFRALP